MTHPATNLKPVGRQAALDGAEHQLAVLDFAVDECRKQLRKASKGDEKDVQRLCYMMWALHLIPLAAHRMLQDYATREPVDGRGDLDAAGVPVAESSDASIDDVPLFSEDQP